MEKVDYCKNDRTWQKRICGYGLACSINRALDSLFSPWTSMTGLSLKTTKTHSISTHWHVFSVVKWVCNSTSNPKRWDFILPEFRWILLHHPWNVKAVIKLQKKKEKMLIRIKTLQNFVWLVVVSLAATSFINTIPVQTLSGFQTLEKVSLIIEQE